MQPRLLQLEGDAGAPLDPAAARLYSAGQALTADGRALELGAGEAQPPRLPAVHEVFGVCGAACLLRRELFTELGGYDESYFAFYEDVDLNVRARIAGWRFAYVPAAVVWHLGNASWLAGFERPGADNARLVARNRLATQIKFMPASAAAPDRRRRGRRPRPRRRAAPPARRPSPASSPPCAGCPASYASAAACAARAICPAPAAGSEPIPRP